MSPGIGDAVTGDVLVLEIALSSKEAPSLPPLFLLSPFRQAVSPTAIPSHSFFTSTDYSLNYLMPVHSLSLSLPLPVMLAQSFAIILSPKANYFKSCACSSLGAWQGSSFCNATPIWMCFSVSLNLLCQCDPALHFASVWAESQRGKQPSGQSDTVQSPF